ncbi:MAG: MG2 domain-containing protein [Candidatus Sulfopaludibacter sp.]|nr:MG2 domain-containing protein [Candidatus Sulfopaludibacter sp.]
MKYRFAWTLIFLAALLAAIAVRVQGLPEAESEAGATYTNGTLRVSIPNRGTQAGAGQLTVEVLSPEDEVLGRVELRVEAGAAPGTWSVEVPLSKALPVEDLVWHRVRYCFTYSGQKEPALEGTDSISSILRRPVVHILGQQTYLAGGNAAVRVILTDSKNQPVAGGSTLRIEGAKGQLLFSGRLNARGTAEAQFRLPVGVTGAYTLRYAVETPIGAAEYSEQVRLEDKASILLTTEKPIYQPGQTMHVRALALDRSRHEATANRALTFEVEDSRGNKVFRKAAQTDRFGIASAEFGLADEVNLGTYHLRALMGENRAELALQVERYVLPKFKVAVEFAKAAHGYRPGGHVTGTVRANYFFGKPVDLAEVTVKASGMDVERFEAGQVGGKTDADGAYRFDLRLPAYFAGRAHTQGAARVLIEATVKDSAGHAETRGEPVTVSESPLLITAVPEGGTMAPHLENQVFVLASYADGAPAAADLTVHAQGNADQKVKTDAGGVAVVRVKDAGGIRVEASDAEGNRLTATVPLELRQGEDQVLLRAERAVYRAGDAMRLRIFSTKQGGAVYVDIVKEGQTVLTRDLDLVNGQAELTMTATPDLAGTLDCNAYLFGRDARTVGDHRLLFVQPADELKVETAVESASYRPGEDARIRFRVTNSRGQGVQAALGLQVVDEAVFALAEKQPGFAKVFFYLEQEAMKPRYEIHSIGMPEVVGAQGAPRELAARALFAATEMNAGNRFETEVGRAAPMAKAAEYTGRYRTALIRKVSASGKEVTDAWGTKVQLTRQPWTQQTYFVLRSAGPDKQFNTADDVVAGLMARRQIVGRPSAGASAVDVSVEHDRGAFNGRAEVAGVVVDQQGGAVEGATVTLTAADGEQRMAHANSDGRFTLAGIPPGEYELAVSGGAERVSRKLALSARDRAVISAALRHQDGGRLVEVAVMSQAGFARGGFGGGGGVMGGILGGVATGAPAGAMPMAAPMMMRREFAENAAFKVADGVGVKKLDGAAAPRTRSYFPEALYINPEIITDGNGDASISIPLADSITTWRMALMASTPRGALGSATGSIKVFQDFFTDLDLPVTLTQGDRVSIPVAVYNYSGTKGAVELQLKAADWYALVEDTADKRLDVESGRVGGAQFTVEAKRIGKFKLTLSARMGGRADIVVREIEVVPNGREQSVVFNGRLESAVQHAVNFPGTAIPDASAVLVRLYPGPLSQVIEGMDSILRMPGGCFEQTSSSTYPNVLALAYMKRMKKLTPEVHAKAEGFIANGYQRLLTFEVPGGGFSWFGNPPANKILTAYGLMEFSDMSKVYDVDPKLIERTQQWLAGQQQADGSWKPDASFINEGATNRYNSDVTRITAYLGWALQNTGYRGAAVDRAREYVGRHMDGKMDAYTLAVVANFAVDYARDRAFTGEAMRLLLDARTEKNDQAWWASQETGVYSTGASAAVETTGLAVQALLKWGEASEAARKALAYLASKKDATGAWGTTQATIMALRALLLSTEKGAADVRGTVEISLNGRTVQTLALTPANNDLLHQFVFKGVDGKAAQNVEIRFNGKGGLAYQVAGRYFIPWTEKPANEPLSITVTYDRTRLAQDDVATATATVRNNLGKAANMVMVDLGIPPGFELLSEDLQAYQEKSAGRNSGRLEKFTQTATQAILYFDSLAAGDSVALHYRLRAKYPIRARTFQSRVYEYYDPAVGSAARPVVLEVGKR